MIGKSMRWEGFSLKVNTGSRMVNTDSRIGGKSVHVRQEWVFTLDRNSCSACPRICTNEDFVIRHHHYGHLYTREEDWLHVQSMIKKHPVVYHSEMEGLIEAMYIDTRSTLGHYLEYIYATPAGLEFLNQAPQNG